jgi:hypothetical protein
MACIHYQPRTTKTPQLGGSPTEELEHHCAVLDQHREKRQELWDFLRADGEGLRLGSRAPQVCPFARWGTEEWERCPFYK